MRIRLVFAGTGARLGCRLFFHFWLVVIHCRFLLPPVRVWPRCVARCLLKGTAADARSILKQAVSGVVSAAIYT